ncbi:uncharacterized protein LOC108194379 [Daucus carota subsp. sativus]|uniref:uncharacterized protein LOC108194379 n=1 Tax=Daucus carota subsp. sativus TaxID=79200 RepID=UPI003083A4D2
MARGEEERRKSSRSAPKTKSIKAISSPEVELPSTLKPKKLFVEATPQGSVAAPAFSDPTGGGRRRGPKRTVVTPQGKHVLTSDARLHLEKLKARRLRAQAGKAYEVANLEDELLALDTRRRMLASRVRQQREIARLEAEMGTASQEYQTRDDDEISWRPSNNSEYSTRADSAGSYSSRHRKKKRTLDEEEEAETGPNPKMNVELTKLRREVAQLREQVKTGSSGLDVPSESPLSEEIESYMLDKNLKIPNIGQFDGTTAPSDFINQFDGRMSYYGHSQISRCRFFCTCLSGTALEWFDNLPPRSIDSWSTLKNKFRTRFSSNKKGGKITASLMTVRQRSSESLRDFLARFRNEVALIPNLIDELAINYLAAGVDKSRHGLILEEFFEKNPRTLQAAMEIFEHRLTIQEAVGSIQMHSPQARRWDRNSGSSSKWEARRPDNRTSQGSEGAENQRANLVTQQSQAASAPQQPRGSWPPRPPREQKEYTKLNVGLNEILAVIKADLNYRPPRPMNPDRPASDRYCDYHEDTGHTTDRCYQLRNLIERKIQSGEFSHWVLKDDPNQAKQPDADRIIDVISGGIAAGGASNNSKKSYAREVFRIDSKRPKRNPSPVISFSDADYSENLLETHQDALVITTKIGTNLVKKILIDNGSSVDILYHGAFLRMDLGDRKLEDARGSPLYGFTGNEVRVVGTIDLPVLFGSPPCQLWRVLKFHVINAECSYNAIIGRTTQSALKAITSITHLKMKFPTEFGIGEVKGDQRMSRQCYISNVKPKRKPHRSSAPSVNQVSIEPPHLDQSTKETLGSNELQANNEMLESPAYELMDIDPQVDQGVVKPPASEPSDIDPQVDQEMVKPPACVPNETLEQISIDPNNSERTVGIGTNLSPQVRQSLISLLQEFSDIFAWSPSDMPGIPEDIALHRLNIKPEFRCVKQKKRTFSPEKQEAIEAELKRLSEAGFIKEVQYPTWIANTVLVKKSNGKWRMCVDYSDLNRACPKDFYPLPNIDQLIDATAGHELISFMDAFSGYNQIKLAKEDQDSTAFITHKGVFAYTVLPFGLLNAGATFQRTMDTVFADQIGRNMEIYVDDMIVKSVKAPSHAKDLRETFDCIRKNQIRLNPAKCSFGLGGGKFLGYLLTQRGIEADPSQIAAVRDMQPPKTVKDLQILTGCIAALRRFIPQSSKRSLPMYEAIKQASKARHFEWTQECQSSLDDIKEFLANPPILARAIPGEPLKLYLSASDSTTAAVLIKEEGTEQRPVYYASHMLKDTETRYSKIEKLVLALVTASRKLRQYFQGRSITVMTSQPLRRVLHRPDISGRLAAWTIELSQFNLEFEPRNSMKSQALSDFVAECNFSESPQQGPAQSLTDKAWTLYTDGSSTSEVGGAGVLLVSPEGFKVQQAIRFGFPATNNEAEYEALIAGIKLASHLDAKIVDIFSDSQLVVKQVSGEFKATNERMIAYLKVAITLLGTFTSWSIKNIARSANHWADALSKLATSTAAKNSEPIYVKELTCPSLVQETVNCITSQDDWRTPIIQHIKGTLNLEDKAEQRKIAFKARNYCLISDQLYRRALVEPLLKCIGQQEVQTAMQEIHSGICGNHISGRNMALKIMRHGVYWPTMKQDCEEYSKKCKACQLYGTVSHKPTATFSASQSPCPFAMWGIDLVGPLPKCTGQKQFLIVAIDYYTKWPEAKPLARIRETEVVQFFMENIVFRFGVPRVIVTDNGSQFTGKDFEEALGQLKITHIKSSVAYPQANGQVEITNKAILQGIKKRLLDAPSNWVDELPNVLWGYRTTPRTATGETPFRLAYGTEAVLPLEISMGSLRIENFNQQGNEEGLRLNIDLVEEVRDRAQLKVAQYQQKVAQYYNAKIKPRQFQENDLVLREAAASMPLKMSKLSAPWEGPYKIIKVVRPGTYRLAQLDGSPIPNTWNAIHLKKFYQ